MMLINDTVSNDPIILKDQNIQGKTKKSKHPKRTVGNNIFYNP